MQISDLAKIFSQFRLRSLRISDSQLPGFATAVREICRMSETSLAVAPIAVKAFVLDNYGAVSPPDPELVFALFGSELRSLNEEFEEHVSSTFAKYLASPGGEVNCLKFMMVGILNEYARMDEPGRIGFLDATLTFMKLAEQTGSAQPVLLVSSILNEVLGPMAL